MKKKLLFLAIVFILLLGGIYLYLDHKARIALTPQECWIDMYDLSEEQINELNPDKDFVKNIPSGDYRFISILGMANVFPNVPVERETDIIIDNGSKMICIGDVTYHEDDGKKSLKLYKYAEKYNRRLLKYLKK